ncbi:TPM domain-containing protein [Pseudomonas segetis]
MLKRHVTDQTGTLTAEQIEQLDQQLVALEKRKGAQMVVLIVSTTAPQDIESYSLAVAEANKIGRKGTDDGLLLLVAKDDRRDRIEVGYGLEGAVPDAVAAHFLREYITPRLKAHDFYGGIQAGVNLLITRIDLEKVQAGNTKHDTEFGLIDKAPFIIMVSFIVLFSAGFIRKVIFNIIGTNLSLWLRICAGAGIIGLLGLFVFGDLTAACTGMILGTLVMSLPPSRAAPNYTPSDAADAPYSGGSHVNSFSVNDSGASTADFSGGGGDFGGGGSSDD